MSRRSRFGALALGLLLVVLGGTLVFRPFASLAVLVLLLAASFVGLGAAELTDAVDRKGWIPKVAALLWVALGLGLLLWPGLGLRTLVLLVAITLLAEGALRIVSGLRRDADLRFAALVGGAGEIVLGALALIWPDITLVVVAVVFGLRVLWAGLGLLWAALRGSPSQRSDKAPGKLARFGAGVRAVATLAVALLLAGLSTTLNGSAPTPDAFYEPSGDVPAEPGQLLRVEDFDRALPDDSEAWRILYTTTRDEGEPAVASALVITGAEPADAPRPVIAWAHGTTGAAEGCAPTLLDDPLNAGAAPAVPEIIENGWTLVATDYVGLGTEGPHPYLIGEGEGRSVLDAVRAAQQMEETDVADKTVVWGHSQGGHAALWAGQLLTSYAPELDVRGVAALAPASDLVGLVGNLDVVPGGALFASYVLKAYDEVYDDVDFDDYVRPAARVPVREMAERCLAEPRVAVSIVESLLFDRSIFSRPPAEGPMGERLRENTPTLPIDAPLLIGQGLADPLVLPAVQQQFAAARCGIGGEVEYREYADFDHVSVVTAPDSPLIPDLLAWSTARFAGEAAPTNCG